MKCVLCKKQIEEDDHGWSDGHNAQPLASGRCCDPCNTEVIKARLKVMSGVNHKAELGEI